MSQDLTRPPTKYPPNLRGHRLESAQDADPPDPQVLRAEEPGAGRRLLQGHLPLVQIAGLGRALQCVHRSDRLAGAEHRAAPAA